MLTDFRLKVFETVARRLNLTRAAEELFITQPAVTRHIKELENQLNIRLLKRENRGLSLTDEGEQFLILARKILRDYDQLNNEIAISNHASLSGDLQLGASSTIAQYVLPSILALFRNKHPDIRICLKSGNTEDIEQAIQHEGIHLGIVEGVPSRKNLCYKPFMEDSVLLVAGSKLNLPSNSVTIDKLTRLPLVMREPGSGTRRIVEEALKQHGITPSQLDMSVSLSNTESIKLFLKHSASCSFLSSLAVRQELRQGELHIIRVRGLDIRRSFRFVSGHGAQSRLHDLFMRFCLTHTLLDNLY